MDGREGLVPGAEIAGEGRTHEIATGGGAFDHALETDTDDLCPRACRSW